MELRLIHGRKKPNEDMQDWGFNDDPIDGVLYVHGTYLTTFSIGFRSSTAAKEAHEKTGWKMLDELTLEINIHEDMIEAGGNYYGDYELVDESAGMPQLPTGKRILFTPQDVIDMAEGRDIPITREQAEELFDLCQDVAQEDMLGTYADALYQFQQEQEAA